MLILNHLSTLYMLHISVRLKPNDFFYVNVFDSKHRITIKNIKFVRISFFNGERS